MPRKTKKEKDKVLLVKEIADKLLDLMGTKAKAEVSEDKESEAIVVNIETEDEAGLLIGSRGETLDSLQTIIGMIFRNKFGDGPDWSSQPEQYKQYPKNKKINLPKPIFSSNVYLDDTLNKRRSIRRSGC